MHRHVLLCFPALVLTVSAAMGQTPVSSAPFYPARLDSMRLVRMVDAQLDSSNAELAAMLEVGGRRTVANTLRRWDDAGDLLYRARQFADLMLNLHPDAGVRAAGEETRQRAEAMQHRMYTNRDYQNAIAGISLQGADPEARRYVALELESFKLGGAGLDSSARIRLNELRDHASALEVRFGRNIAEDTTHLEFTEVELAGLPQPWIQPHQRSADGKVILGMSYPDLFPALTYASNPATRRVVMRAFANRGWPANVSVLDSLLRLRWDIAHQLGYRNWAEDNIARHMVPTADSASAFIESIRQRSASAVNAIVARYLAALQQENPGVTQVQVSDMFHAPELVRRSDYDVDGRLISEYFPAEAVRRGVLTVAGRLFHLEFRQVTVPVWAPSVTAYEVWDHGTLRGRIYLDLSPRTDKYEHAAMAGLRRGIRGRELPQGVLMTNLPAADSTQPGLMAFDDVVTLFHEFGHLLHLMYATSDWGGLSWPIEQDFIEAPSQLFEEWVTQPGVLRLFARNYRTGEPIPADLVRRLHDAGEFDRALSWTFQDFLAALSLELHRRNPDSLDVEAFSRQLGSHFMPVPMPSDLSLATSFDHLGDQNYSAAYYTYLWSEALAKDLWTGFDPRNPFAPGPAARYRDLVLKPGGTLPADQLLRNFLGRPWSMEAWERWMSGHDRGESPVGGRGP
jgi:thimet oligopeptidase